jgi:hypothetical protein
VDVGFALRLFRQRPCSATVPGWWCASECAEPQFEFGASRLQNARFESVTKKHAARAGTDATRRNLLWVRRKPSGGTFVPENEITVRLQAHRQNIARYRSLLKTELNEIERAFIDRRIAEEETQVRRLSALARRQRIAEAAGGLVPFDSSVSAEDWVTQS